MFFEEYINFKIFYYLTHYGRQPLFSADFAETYKEFKNGKNRIPHFLFFLQMKNNEDICNWIFSSFLMVYIILTPDWPNFNSV
jgi:hypothetical protein